MLGFEGERRLFNLLNTLREIECAQERRRQRLCSIPDFAPYSAFIRMDRDANEYISSQEILNYLRENREYTVTIGECLDLMNYFDCDEDGRLSYREQCPYLYQFSFQQIILPCEDNVLRSLTLQRPHFRVSRFDTLPHTMELELTSILYHEINLMRRLMDLKQDLTCRYDFTNHSAFRTLDKYNNGLIDIQVLRQFFRNNQAYISDKEALAIIRRIDTDGDAKISYQEFTDFLNHQINVYTSYRKDWRSQSEYRPQRSTFQHEPSPMQKPRAPLRCKTTDKKARPQVSFYDSVYTPVKPQQSTLHMSELKTAEKSYYSPSPYSGSKSYQKQMTEVDTVHVLKEYTHLEKTLEQAKQRLGLRTDFNLYDAFKIFDVRNAGSIDFIDLKSGFNQVGLFPTNEELNLFLKRYDADKNGRLRFLEFSQAFTPVDPTYNRLVASRHSNNLRNSYYRDDCFSYSTRQEFKELLQTILKVERVAESLRKEVTRDPHFDFYDAFKTCDINNDGVITKRELRKAMDSRGFYTSELELSTLMNKLDKDHDGKVSYAEFMDEFRPKSLF